MFLDRQDRTQISSMSSAIFMYWYKRVRFLFW